MSKTALQPDRPGRPRRRLRRRRLPLPLPRRHALRPRRRLHLRGHGRPLQRRPGQQPRQPAGARRHRRRQEVRRRRPGAARRQPAGRRRRPTAYDATAARPGTAVQPSRGPRRDVAARSAPPTPTSRPTSRGRPSPARRSTPCWATPSRRCASSPCSPRRPSRDTAQAIWERIGLPGPVERPAPARRRGAGAATRAGSPVDEGRRRSSPARPDAGIEADAVRAWAGPTATATSTTTACPAAPTRALAAARAAGVDRASITVGTDAATRAAAIDRRRPATTTCGPRSACTRTTPRNGVDAIVDLLDAPEGRRRRRVRARLPLRPLAARRPARGLRRPDRARPRARPAARHPHPRGVGRHVRRPRAPRACPSARSSTASPAAPTRPRRCLDLGAYLSFSGIVTFKTAADVREAAAAVPRSTACSSRPTRPTSRRCRTGASRNQPAFVPARRCRRGRRPRALTSSDDRGRHLRERRCCVPVTAPVAFRHGCGRHASSRRRADRVDEDGHRGSKHGDRVRIDRGVLPSRWPRCPCLLQEVDEHRTAPAAVAAVAPAARRRPRRGRRRPPPAAVADVDDAARRSAGPAGADDADAPTRRHAPASSTGSPTTPDPAVDHDRRAGAGAGHHTDGDGAVPALAPTAHVGT